MNLRRKVHLVLGAAALSAVLASCGGSNNFRDLEGVKSVNPDSATVYNNVDGHPNLVVLCIKGKAFVTANRDYKPYSREPDLDSTCAPNLGR